MKHVFNLYRYGPCRVFYYFNNHLRITKVNMGTTKTNKGRSPGPMEILGGTSLRRNFIGQRELMFTSYNEEFREKKEKNFYINLVVVSGSFFFSKV